MFELTSLASGSKGNCTLIENDTSAYIIDCGLSFKKLCEKMKALGKDLGKLKGIFVTHEHADHASGVRICADKLDIAVYANHDTALMLKQKNRMGKKCVIFENGQEIFLDGMCFQPFSVPHDAVNTVAYKVECEGRKISVLTDLGSVTELVVNQVQGSEVLILECNYDQDMLMNCGRPWRTIQRIMSRHGHLSNEQAMELLERLMHPGLKDLYIGHISEDTNDYALVYDVVTKTLDKLGRNDIKPQILRRHGLLEA
ncbi:Beta-lactamase-like protein [Lentisphaera araneosa HTCC2155]|uniref:Beta-lactamase-like protein n=1 Tax=Lentisphaera araneosa HTCC2155 TaxID=313628 RepID=A6DHK9_9BACT|nr:MBL fold metallo-hydrolase [Lentisphaera araneosa]EDM29092.1 Beta-lactamase-like protein [Lentisphaera araneosa HTCC2155]